MGASVLRPKIDEIVYQYQIVIRKLRFEARGE